MLQLPAKFKQALGPGSRTSLYPLVKIYKGYQIDDTIPDDAESINLSIKETSIKNLDGTYSGYLPLLLNTPQIVSKADIINNKYTISNVSLSISNAPYNGKIFSDDIPSLLNAVVQVYYAATGLDTLDDCLLVYTGTIRRYNQSKNDIKLTLEDLTEQKLKTTIPSTLVEDELQYKHDDIGKPYPLVYGYVDNSPTIKKGLDTLEIDKPNKEIFGFWSGTDYYQNPAIKEGHPLVENGYLRQNKYLSAYKDGFVSIYEKGPKHFGSGIYEVEDLEFYNFNNATSDNSANIILNADAYIDTTEEGDEEETFAIPSRMYRPIVDATFYAKNLNHQSDYFQASNNKFIGYKNDDGSMQTIINNIAIFLDSETDNSESMAQDIYNEFWDNGPNEGDVLKFWQPTQVNDAYELDTEEIRADVIDENWKQFYNGYEESAKFPIDMIQNNDENCGLHITATNLSYGQTQGAGSFARLFLNQDATIGDFPCVTKIFYDACFFTNGNIDNPNNLVYQGSQPRFASFWAERFLMPEASSTPTFINTLQEWLSYIPSYGAIPPQFPNGIHEMVVTERADDGSLGNEIQTNNTDYARLEYEDGLLHNTDGVSNIIQSFNTTNAFDSIQFGSPSFTNTGVNYVSANLKEIYVLQDFLLEDYANLDYYASVGGRVKDGNIITTAQDILENILTDELSYDGNVDNQNTDIQNNWQYGFTVNEQIEAKEIFEGIFKSSLLIPTFNSAGQFKFIGIKQIIESYTDVQFISNDDVLNYSFQLTKLDDVYNSVNVHYKKNYASGDYDSQTGFNIDNGIYENYDQLTTDGLGYSEGSAYSIDYYGKLSTESKLEVESDYIRDKYTAEKLQKRLLMWYCNQHLVTKIDLPPHYMYLEAGDYIKFSELLGGNLAFGYDYTTPEQRNGQLIYDVFFITKISKYLSKVMIEAVQVHRGEYGYPSIAEEDTGDIINGNGNDVTENYQLPDPGDDSNYSEDSIDTEEWDSIVDPFLRLDMTGSSILNDGTVYALVSTNMDETWEYNIWAKNISDTFTYNNTTYEEAENIPLGEVDASDLVNVALNMDGNNGILQIEKKFELYPENALIEFVIEVKNTADYQDEAYFTQFGMPEEEFEFNGLYGDVNQDDVINVLDVVTVVTSIVSDNWDNFPKDDEGRNIADMNGDGQVNVLDIVMLVQVIVGG